MTNAEITKQGKVQVYKCLLLRSDREMADFKIQHSIIFKDSNISETHENVVGFSLRPKSTRERRELPHIKVGCQPVIWSFVPNAATQLTGVDPGFLVGGGANPPEGKC